jgi:ketosteroid isomerase-like protein
MRSFIIVLFVSLFFAGCTKTDEAVDVQELNRDFVSAWNNKDADKLEDMMADDVDFIQGEIHYSGKAEVVNKWVDETIGTISKLKTNVVNSGVDEHIAYEAGTFSVDVLPEGPGQPAGFGEGNFMLLWKKGEDGNWKLSYAQLEDLPVQVKQ